jgi:hypothetical protein
VSREARRDFTQSGAHVDEVVVVALLEVVHDGVLGNLREHHHVIDAMFPTRLTKSNDVSAI